MQIKSGETIYLSFPIFQFVHVRSSILNTRPDLTNVPIGTVLSQNNTPDFSSKFSLKKVFLKVGIYFSFNLLDHRVSEGVKSMSRFEKFPNPVKIKTGFRHPARLS
jgi:hypothetical protein